MIPAFKVTDETGAVRPLTASQFLYLLGDEAQDSLNFRLPHLFAEHTGRVPQCDCCGEIVVHQKDLHYGRHCSQCAD